MSAILAYYCKWRAGLLFYLFKYTGLCVLSHIVPVEVAAVHGHIYTMREGLYKGECVAQVEKTVGATKFDGYHSAGEYDGFVFYIFCQHTGWGVYDFMDAVWSVMGGAIGIGLALGIGFLI